MHHSHPSQLSLKNTGSSLLSFFVFLDPVDATKAVRRAEVLVPNTCEYDSSQASGTNPPAPVLGLSPRTIEVYLFIKLNEFQLRYSRWHKSTVRRRRSRNLCLWTFQQTSDGEKKPELRFFQTEPAGWQKLPVWMSSTIIHPIICHHHLWTFLLNLSLSCWACCCSLSFLRTLKRLQVNSAQNLLRETMWQWSKFGLLRF